MLPGRALHVFRLHRDTPHQGRATLDGAVNTHGDFSEQLASRLELITNRGLVDAVDVLYFDARKGTPQRGATNRKRRGTLGRLVALVQQLDLTYDLYGLTSGEILALLPDEFSAWKSPPS
jgi:hypothetical protein